MGKYDAKLIEIQKRRTATRRWVARRMDAGDNGVDWITVENGEHVPIKGGKAVGGPMNGRDFSRAKSVSGGTMRGKTGAPKTGNNSGWEKFSGPQRKTPGTKQMPGTGSFPANSGKKGEDYGVFSSGRSPNFNQKLIRGKTGTGAGSTVKKGTGSGAGMPATGRAVGPVKKNNEYKNNGWMNDLPGLSKKDAEKTLKTAQDLTQKYYDAAKAEAQKETRTHFWTYTDHGPEHIKQVIEESMQAADAVDRIKGFSGAYDQPVDRKTLLVACQFHDTGMDGAGRDYAPDGTEVRKAHGINSALHVLQNRDAITEMGLNPEEVAMVVFGHTKSNSEVNDLSSYEDWKVGLNKLQEQVNIWNNEHGADEQIKFDRNAVFGGEPTSENIKRMASMTAAIRLGDANREATTPLHAQAGGEYKIERNPPVGCRPDKECKNHSDILQHGVDAEVAAAKISITDDEGRHELSDDDPKISKVKGWRYSASVVLGERNLLNVDAVYDKKTDSVQESVILRSASIAPYCTVQALLERVGELSTINGVSRTMKIHLPGITSWNNVPKETKKALLAMQKAIRTDINKKTGKPMYPGMESLVISFDGGGEKSLSLKNKNYTT